MSLSFLFILKNFQIILICERILNVVSKDIIYTSFGTNKITILCDVFICYIDMFYQYYFFLSNFINKYTIT